MDNTQLEAVIAAKLAAGVASAKQPMNNDMAVSAYYTIREEIRKRGGPLSTDGRPKQTS
jgi:hypothetical protein